MKELWRRTLLDKCALRPPRCFIHHRTVNRVDSHRATWVLHAMATAPGKIPHSVVATTHPALIILIQQASTSLLVQIFSPSNLHYHRRWRSTARPIVHDTCARPTRNPRKCKPASYQVSSAISDGNVPVPWVIWDVTAVHGSKVVLSLSCSERNLTNLYLHGSATKVVDIQALAGEVSLAIFSAALRPLSCWRCVTDEVQEANDKAF